MKILGIVLFAVSVLSQTSFASAQEPTMDGLVGRWRCEGKSFPADGGQPYPIEVYFTVTKSLDGEWLQGDYVQLKTKENPSPARMSVFISVHPKSNGLHTFIGIPNKPFYFLTETKGWLDSRFSFDGQIIGLSSEPVGFRETWTKVDEDTITSHGDIRLSEGTWISHYSELCKRTLESFLL